VTEFSRLRDEGFREHLAQNGVNLGNILTYDGNDTALDHVWQGAENARLRQWITSLPRPLGLFAINDNLAMIAVEEAQRAGRAVPEDVAVIGVDNDELHCFFTDPPITSVALPTERVGYEAATLLDCLMAGDAPPTKPLLLAPLDVVCRPSTDVLAIQDVDMANTLRLIRQRSSDPHFQIDDLLKHIPWSRRTLEKKFREHLKRSPHDELIRIRMQTVRHLLAESDMSIQEIALKSGFSSAERMAVVFRHEIGTTPSAYRSRIIRR